MKNVLALYCVFHCNLAYSSIDRDQRRAVIDRCYWPLLRLARELELPVGIEASGYTLQTIAQLDPAWIQEFCSLLAQGRCECIGSGYAQIIGPLVPARLNRENQRLGMLVYEHLLGRRPEIALVNEQAWSAGMVQVYLQAGYRGVIMEWDNPSRFHPEWQAHWRYYPQLARDQWGETIPVLWNNAVAFQKMQRYVHDEITLAEYMDYLESQRGKEPRFFSLYGNDAEVFDFRPGRYETEPAGSRNDEWQRLREVFVRVLEHPDMTMIPPSRVLDALGGHREAGHALGLESPGQPVPVKKQPKYNLLRWAVTGRDDFALNTTCWELYQRLAADASSTDAQWCELCYLWASDFRTHITHDRWLSLGERLAAARQTFPTRHARINNQSPPRADRKEYRLERQGHFLTIHGPGLVLRLNCRRGLAIDRWWNPDMSGEWLVGTLAHGYFDDIHYCADFYSGHLVLEVPGRHKITDLQPVQPEWEEGAGELRIRGTVSTPIGPVHKCIICREGRVTMRYHLQWPVCPLGSLRLGYLTVNPAAFSEDKLFFQTHNGGRKAERFVVGRQAVAHQAPVSPLVSVGQGLGMTEGELVLGDTGRAVRISQDRSSAACTGHIFYLPVDGRFLYRFMASLMEIDDTCCSVLQRDSFADFQTEFCWEMVTVHLAGTGGA